MNPSDKTRLKHVGRPQVGSHQETLASSTNDDTVQRERKQLGDYQIIDEIARGGMGVVYRARQINADRIVALKLIRGSDPDAKELERFEAEARAAAKLDHPNIVPIYDVGRIAGEPFFTMKLVEGQSLAKRLDGKPIEAKLAASIVRDIAAGIAHAHQNKIIHRDLKPENVLLETDDWPLVTDFGLAKILDRDSGLTRTGQAIGTPSYMSPEQAVGGREVGPPSDVYSMGAVLYACLTGQPPFQCRSSLATVIAVMREPPISPRSLRSQVPKDLETICLKCLEKLPDNRYRSVMELRDDLQRFLDHKPVTARRIGWIPKTTRWAQRNPLAVSILASLLLGLLGTSFFAHRARVNENLANQRAVLLEANAVELKTKTTQLQTANEMMQRQLYGADFREAAAMVRRGEWDAAFSKLGSLIPVAGQKDRRGFEWRFLWQQCFSGHRLATGMDSIPMAMDISSDNRIMCVSAGHEVYVWNYIDQELIRVMRDQDARFCQFTSDGSAMLTVSHDNLHVWNTRDWKLMRRLRLQAKGVSAMATLHHPRFVAMISPWPAEKSSEAKRWALRIFDLQNLKIEPEVHPVPILPSTIQLSNDDQTVLVTGPDRCWLLDRETGQEVSLEIDCLPSLHPSGKMVATDTGIWEWRTGKCLLEPGSQSFHVNGGNRLFFSPTGGQLAISRYGGGLRVLDTLSWERIADLNIGNQRVARYLCWSPDETFLLLGGAYQNEDNGHNDFGKNRSRASVIERPTGGGVRVLDVTKGFADVTKVDGSNSLAGSDHFDFVVQCQDSPLASECLFIGTQSGDVVRVNRHPKSLRRITVSDQPIVDLVAINEWQCCYRDELGHVGLISGLGNAMSPVNEKLVLPSPATSLASVPGASDAVLVGYAAGWQSWNTKTSKLGVLTPAPLNVERIIAGKNTTVISQNNEIAVFNQSGLERERYRLQGQFTRDSFLANQYRMSIKTPMALDSSGTIYAGASNGAVYQLKASAEPQEIFQVPFAIQKILVLEKPSRVIVVDEIDQAWVFDPETRRPLLTIPAEGIILDFSTSHNGRCLCVSTLKSSQGGQSEIRWIFLPGELDVAEDLRQLQQQDPSQLEAVKLLNRIVKLPSIASDESVLSKLNTRLSADSFDRRSPIPILEKADYLRQSIASHSGSVHELANASKNDLILDNSHSPVHLEGFVDDLDSLDSGVARRLCEHERCKIKQIDRQRFLLVGKTDVYLFNLLTNKKHFVARLRSSIESALVDRRRGLLYVGTAGEWNPRLDKHVYHRPTGVYRINFENGQMQTLYEVERANFYSLDLSKDNRFLVASGEKTRPVRIDLETLETKKIRSAQSGAICTIDQKLDVLLALEYGRFFSKVDYQKDQKLDTVRHSLSGQPRPLMSIDDKGKMVAIFNPNTLVVLDVSSGDVICQCPGPFNFQSDLLLADDKGRRVYAAAMDGVIHRIDLEANAAIVPIDTGLDQISGIATLEPDSVFLLSNNDGIHTFTVTREVVGRVAR